jgi:dihydropteroate synthase
MKNSRLQKFEKPVEFEPSLEQVAQAREAAVNMIMAVFERMPKDNIQPVKESLQELARQAKEGVPRQSTIIQTGGGSSEVPKKSTLIISGGSSEVPKNVTSNILSDSDLELLRKIQNGE